MVAAALNHRQEATRVQDHVLAAAQMHVVALVVVGLVKICPAALTILEAVVIWRGIVTVTVSAGVLSLVAPTTAAGVAIQEQIVVDKNEL